ncbi:hypothetical protein ED551_07480 [Muribaculaceae bacterium Isolate-013 (NCI)]|nr:hypothetical protein ED551_07480 [Muribaculaceae bacterium Isolate-013 (NCI)]
MMKTLMSGALALALTLPLCAHGRNRVPATGRAGNLSLQSAAPSSLPSVFYEDFEGIPDLGVSSVGCILPAFGWSVSGGASGYRFEAYYLKGLPGHSGNYYLYSSYDEDNDRNEWAVTPAVRLEAGKNYRFGMFVNAPGYGKVTDEFRVMAGTVPDAAGLTSVVADATGASAIVTDATEWRELAARFSPTATADYYFGINHCSRRNGNFVAFDDIRISEIPLKGGEFLLPHEPYFGFTMIPSSWTVTTPLVVDYQVRNSGDESLSGASVTVAATTPAGSAGTRTSAVATLQWDETDDGTASFNGFGTQDAGNATCKLTLHGASGEVYAEKEVAEIALPDRTTPWLARDNGVIAGCMSLKLFESMKTAGRLGTRFQVAENTLADAVRFVLLGGYSTATSVIARIYQINKKGVIFEYAASRREELATESEGYTEYTLTFPAPVELVPGDYIMSLDEGAGEALGLALASNYTGHSLAFSLDGEEWSVLPGTPCLRLRTADGTSVASVEKDGDFKILSRPGCFVIEGNLPDGARLRVYAASGALLLDRAVSADSTVDHTLSPGMYVAEVCGYASRVVVRP